MVGGSLDQPCTTIAAIESGLRKQELNELPTLLPGSLPKLSCPLPHPLIWPLLLPKIFVGAITVAVDSLLLSCDGWVTYRCRGWYL
jgi:hypothetical protein